MKNLKRILWVHTCTPSTKSSATWPLNLKSVLNIINFTVTDEELLARIKKRSQEESRADDSVFDKRLAIYKKSHNEIIESLLKDHEVINIDANDQINSISQKIIEKLSLNWCILYWLLNTFLLFSPIQEISIGKNSRRKFTS